MKLLKDRLKNNIDSLLNACKDRSRYVVKIAAVCVAAVMALAVAAHAPELHGYWLRNKVESRVYLISGKSGLGTGFAIVAPSGITYILTNDHVCGVSKDGITVDVTDSQGNSIPRRIIERSKYSDLCLIEGVPGVKGLSLGNEPSVGQVVAAIGHPAGYGITMSRGEIIEKKDIYIGIGIISVMLDGSKYTPLPKEDGGISEEECSLPKNRIREVLMPMAFWLVPAKICLAVTKGAYNTNVLVQPGSSGSPLVNFYGNVIGAVFASDRAGWGSAVSRDDIIDFLKLY
jgi:S1-C subfamily serine protease